MAQGSNHMSDLIHYQTGNRLMHASGPVPTQFTRYIYSFGPFALEYLDKAKICVDFNLIYV